MKDILWSWLKKNQHFEECESATWTSSTTPINTPNLEDFHQEKLPLMENLGTAVWGI